MKPHPWPCAVLAACFLSMLLHPAIAVDAPSFQTLKSAYSSTQAPAGFKEFCAKNGNSQPNTCAIRLAYALQAANKDFFKGITPKSGIAWKGLPPRASDLAIILNQQLQVATVIKDASHPVNLELLKNKQGIIFFDTITEFNGTGHISLWDKSAVVDGGDYTTASPRIYFWPLK